MNAIQLSWVVNYFYIKNLWENPGGFDNREIIVVIDITEVSTSYLYAAWLPHYQKLPEEMKLPKFQCF